MDSRPSPRAPALSCTDSTQEYIKPKRLCLVSPVEGLACACLITLRWHPSPNVADALERQGLPAAHTLVPR